MESSKKFLEEKMHLSVLGGYFCPIPDSKLKKKLNGISFPLEHRLRMLYLALEDTEWMISKSLLAGAQVLFVGWSYIVTLFLCILGLEGGGRCN
jgi:hypothetical protein